MDATGIYQSPYEMRVSFLTVAWLSLMLLAISTGISASNYYFSTTSGDDSRSFEDAQDPSTPWKTVDKVNEIFSRLQPGDSILFKRNEVFPGGIALTRPGSKAAPIVLGAYGTGDDPVISGFIQVAKWTSIGNGIYESNALSTGAEVNMVVINGLNYAKGRFPNADAENGGYLTIESTSNNAITDSKFPGSSDWVGAQLVLRTTHWTIERKTVTSQSGKTFFYDSSTAYSPNPGFGYFLQDHRKTLDQYGEWYYNPKSKKLSVYFGENGPGEFSQVQVSAVDVLVDPRANHIVINGLTLEGANKFGIFYDGYGMDNFQVRNSTIRFSGIDAVYLVGWSHFVMEDCSILNSNNCGLRLLGQDPNSTIRNNEIRNTGMQAGMGGDGDGNYAALFTSSPGLIAEYNTIINTGYIGIRFAFEKILVKNNYIDNFCRVMDDGAGIYTYDSRGASGTAYDRKVISNIVLNGLGAPEGTPSTHGAAEGIYLDDNSYNVEVTGNTVANCGSRGIFIHNAGHFMLSRNTIYNNGVQLSTVHDQYGNSITGAVIKNNIFFSKEVSQMTSHMKSSTKDFQTMGKFTDNYYARPFDDSLTIAVEYLTGDGARVLQPFTLKDWQSTYNQDQGSGKSPVQIKPYQVDHIKEVNQVTNGYFTENEVGIWCWSPSTECLSSWQPTSVIGDGVLQVKGQGPSFLGMDCGAMVADQYYILRFSAAANKESNIEIFLQQSKWPWEKMSGSRAVKIGTSRAEYELLFSVPASEPFSSLQFGFDNQGHTYWLDNIEFFEVDARMTNPDSYIRFEYNAGKENKTVSLTDSYVDVTGKTYSGSIELRSFESIILIKDTDRSDQPGSDPDTDPTADPDPGSDPDQNPDGEQPTDNGGGEPDPDTDPNPGVGSGEQPDSGSSSDPDQDTDSNPDPEPPLPGSQSSPLGNRDFKPIGFPKPIRGGVGKTQGLVRQETLTDWQLYPNPVSSYQPELTIEYYAKINNPVTMYVVDQFGRNIKELKPVAEQGWNQVRLDTSELPSGTYFLHIPNMAPPAKSTFRFVVIRN